jgi:hypothetical protein
MLGLPVPIVDDIEWIRLQEEIKHQEKQKKEEEDETD